MSSSRDRQLLRDLNRLDRRREAEATDRSTEDENRRQRLQRVLARLSRLESSRPTYGIPPTEHQSLYDWAPTRTSEDQLESDQAASRRRALYRRNDLRSAAIMQNARTSVLLPSATQQQNEDANDTNDARSAYRRTYLADSPAEQEPLSSTSVSRPSPLLESAVRYLDDVRDCSSYDESLSSALDHGLFTPECYDDLITDTESCLRPQPSSWLAPGAISRGTQHTTTSGKASSARSPGVFDATRPWLAHNPSSYSRFTSSLSGNPFSYLSLPPRDVQDRWPVKVTIQAVDLANMTMAGTMEAFDVPNTTHSTAETCTPAPPITTYLEGQIIDLNVHTFLTPAKSPNTGGITFPPTTAQTDASYWRNLPPFNSMKSDEEVARAMLSRAQMDEIMSEWIFMRWKERCFIHSETDLCHRHADHPTAGEGDDNDLNHGLTISGFYYVSLRRSDGNIDGLYFDTKTSPYQHLRLAARSRGTLGSWQFK
ncbi:hypothetical protein QM012_001477 [Aureobasidium pullulans]|uniref:Vacuolar import and degradation protein-domain-containing protein n=1 Tax=Aureobasidium pullulans TaxID=5580 RepID=A0ABR0TEH0_AURPU